MAFEMQIWIPYILELLVFILVSSLLLMVSSKIFKTKDQRYGTALKIVAIIYVIQGILNYLSGMILGASYAPSLIWILGIVTLLLVAVASYFLIKKFYLLDYKEAGKVFIVWFAFDLIANFIISYITAFLYVPFF